MLWICFKNEEGATAIDNVNNRARTHQIDFLNRLSTSMRNRRAGNFSTSGGELPANIAEEDGTLSPDESTTSKVNSPPNTFVPVTDSSSYYHPKLERTFGGPGLKRQHSIDVNEERVHVDRANFPTGLINPMSEEKSPLETNCKCKEVSYLVLHVSSLYYTDSSILLFFGDSFSALILLLEFSYFNLAANTRVINNSFII